MTTCPSANGTLFTPLSGASSYNISCLTDYPGFDLPSTNATSLPGCISSCASYTPNASIANGAACVAITYAVSNPNGNKCYLKYEIGSGPGDVLTGSTNASGYDSAIREGYVIGSGMSFSTGISASASSSTTSSATTMSMSTASATLTSTSTSTGIAATQTPLSASSSNSGLSTGAQAGVGVGVGLGGLLALIALILFIMRQRKQKRSAASRKSPGVRSAELEGDSVLDKEQQSPSTVSATTAMRTPTTGHAELEGSEWDPVTGGFVRVVGRNGGPHEAPAVVTR